MNNGRPAYSPKAQSKHRSCYELVKLTATTACRGARERVISVGYVNIDLYTSMTISRVI